MAEKPTKFWSYSMGVKHLGCCLYALGALPFIHPKHPQHLEVEKCPTLSREMFINSASAQCEQHTRSVLWSLHIEPLRIFHLLQPTHWKKTHYKPLNGKYGECCPLVAFYNVKWNLEVAWVHWRNKGKQIKIHFRFHKPGLCEMAIYAMRRFVNCQRLFYTIFTEVSIPLISMGELGHCQKWWQSMNRTAF